MLHDPDADLRRDLNRHKAFATGLLVLMAGLIVVGYALPSGPWSALLQASAKAGFVGGIADWFAVTALFRHPLGLPIPHTAIIPRQKARLGRALGRFVAGHVITPAEVSRVLGRLDVSTIAARFLMDPTAARPAAQALADMLPRVLATIEDGRARRTLARLVPRLVGGPGAGIVVARALRTLVDGGRHQEVMTFLMGEIRSVLESKHDQLHDFIEDKVRAQGGRLVGWVLGAQVANRVMGVLRDELDRVDPDGSSIPRGIRRVGPARAGSDGNGPGAGCRDRPRDSLCGGARDGPGLVVGRVGTDAGSRSKPMRRGRMAGHWR